MVKAKQILQPRKKRQFVETAGKYLHFLYFGNSCFGILCYRAQREPQHLNKVEK